MLMHGDRKAPPKARNESCAVSLRRRRELSLPSGYDRKAAALARVTTSLKAMMGCLDKKMERAKGFESVWETGVRAATCKEVQVVAVWIRFRVAPFGRV